MELYQTLTDFGGAAISRSAELPHNPSLSEAWDRGWPQSREDFKAFVDVFQERVFRFIYYRLKNRQDAEDILQAVFLKAFHDRVKLRKVKTQAGSYLFRMARNACIDHHRKQMRMPPVSEAGPDREPGIASPSETKESEELGRIHGILKQIPAKQSEVIRLRVMDDLSFSEIAKILGCFETTARTRYRYGVKKLRQIIQKEERNQ